MKIYVDWLIHSGVTYAALIPISHIRLEAVIMLLSSLAKKLIAYAISKASPSLPIGLCTKRRLIFSSVFKNLVIKSVLIGPGLMQFILIFSLA